MRLARVGLHLLYGAATVAAIYPFVTCARRRWLKQRWSQQLLEILNIRLERYGVAPAPASLLVANHISWLDIYVINAACPSAFVSKDDVRHWPLIGWLAARTETLFLQRGSRRHAHAMSEAVGAVLNGGGNVAVFPEGTTTDGLAVRHFHAALLQPAIDAGRPVQPMALRYLTPQGEYCGAPAYVGDTTLLQCLKAILAQPTIVAALHIMPPMDAATRTRRALADAAHGLIAAHVQEVYPVAETSSVGGYIYEPIPAKAGI